MGEVALEPNTNLPSTCTRSRPLPLVLAHKESLQEGSQARSPRVFIVEKNSSTDNKIESAVQRHGVWCQ